MKRFSYYCILTAAAAILAASCNNKSPQTPTTGPEQDTTSAFAKGADISWTTEMERDGIRFKTADGVEMECTALMKELGLDAIRLRVWVDPQEGWCGKEDVLVKARRVQ